MSLSRSWNRFSALRTLTTCARPSSKAEHCGTLITPRSVHLCRIDHEEGWMSLKERRHVEGFNVAEVMHRQMWFGFKALSGGFRREYSEVDFLRHLSGLTLHKSDFTWANGQFQPAILDLRVTDKIRHVKAIEVSNFEHMQSYLIDVWWYPLPLKDARIKTILPSPTSVLTLPGRDDVYTAAEGGGEEEEEFYEDVAKAWRDEIQALAEAGCRYIQLDESHLSSERDVRLINAALRDRPEDMTVALYLGRPPDRESMAQMVFNDMNIDTYMLDFEEGDSFEPLRHLPHGHKQVVLGLVSPQFRVKESKDAIIARIHEAAQYAPLEQLAVASRGGFGQPPHGDLNQIDEQWDKMKLVRAVADEVWGPRS